MTIQEGGETPILDDHSQWRRGWVDTDVGRPRGLPQQNVMTDG